MSKVDRDKEIKGEVLNEIKDWEKVSKKYGRNEHEGLTPSTNLSDIFLKHKKENRTQKVVVDVDNPNNKVPTSDYVKEGRLLECRDWIGDEDVKTIRLIEDPNQDFNGKDKDDTMEDRYDDVVLNDWLDEICSIKRSLLVGRKVRNVYVKECGTSEDYTSPEDTPSSYGKEVRQPDYHDYFINRWRTNKEDSSILISFLEGVIKYVSEGNQSYDEDGVCRYVTDDLFELTNFLDHLPEKKERLRYKLGLLLSKTYLDGGGDYEGSGIGRNVIPDLVEKYTTPDVSPTPQSKYMTEEGEVMLEKDYKIYQEVRGKDFNKVLEKKWFNQVLEDCDKEIFKEEWDKFNQEEE